MMNHLLTWRCGVIVSCGAAAVVFIFWDWFKKSSQDKCSLKASTEEKQSSNQEDVRCVTDNFIAQLPDPKWIKVGQVKELYYYPLKSGRGKELKECQFTEYGIAVSNHGHLTLRDRMFLIYNEENGKFVTGRNYPTLILVSLVAVDESRVRLEAVGMPPLVFELPECSETGQETDCTMWWDEPIKSIDCGVAPAEWISTFLTGTDSGLRVGLARMSRRNIINGPWEKFTKIYDTLTNDDVGLFADIASYMLMTESSIEELNKRLDSPVSTLQFRPNIVISGTEPFVEDNWEWIKLGECAVIRNVKPCPRCAMTKINPENGVADKEEPLRTLRKFRAQTDPKKISVDGKAPVLGIYCGLYSLGNVKVGDDVYVHVSKDSCTTQI